MSVHKPTNLYFNITTGCNSACIFCASNSPSRERHILPTELIVSAYKKSGIDKNDEVVLNGGEPTTHPGISTILTQAIALGARVTLFTNGRRLSHPKVAKKILIPGLHRISVPLYGSSPTSHDSLTGVRGSFDQTKQGLDNIFDSQKETGYPRQIEIKLLSIRPSLPEWGDIIRLIHSRWGKPDRVLLSGLILSNEVSLRKDILIPSLDELKKNVSSSLEQLSEFQIHTILWNIPLCVIDPVYYPIINDTKIVNDTILNLYYDPTFPDGIQVNESEKGDTFCKKCDLTKICATDERFFIELERATMDR